jgi:peptidylglycine monooxygenase
LTTIRFFGERSVTCRTAHSRPAWSRTAAARQQETAMQTTTPHVGLGEQIYRVERPFGTLPPGVAFGMISKCAVDAEGRLYICQRSDPPVIVFDGDGRFVRSFGQGLITDSHGIAISPDQHVLVVDRDGHQVLCFDQTGSLLFALGDREPHFQAPFNHPTDVAQAPNGDIYVADGYGNTRVHRFSAGGELKHSWGEPGTGPGQFTTPHGIKALPGGRILVGDRENNRVQVFDADGIYLSEWRGFFHPMEIHVDPRGGLVYVSDQIPRVHALTPEGRLVGACKPVLAQGHGTSGDAEGNLYFVETRVPVITKLVPLD